MHVDGSCHCGYITYSAEVDPEMTSVCHCTDCQQLTGTAFRWTVPANKDKFRLLSGEPTIYIKTTAESGNPRAQAFCPKCGSPIYAANPVDPPVYGLRVGTLRQRDQFVPKKQIWCQSQQPWAQAVGSITPRAEKQTK